MNTDTVELRPVTADNWRQCVALELEPGQTGFVSSNLFSLAQSKFEPCRLPCAIYNSAEQLVGFAMYNHRPLPDGSFRISRMMIDKAFQGRGYSRKAANEIIERMRRIGDCHEIYLDYAPENSAAAGLWGSLGFEVCGKEGSNLLARLRFE